MTKCALMLLAGPHERHLAWKKTCSNKSFLWKISKSLHTC